MGFTSRATPARDFFIHIGRICWLLRGIFLKFDQHMQQTINRHVDVMRLRAGNDIAVQAVDFRAADAPQILRGRRILLGHRLRDAADRMLNIRRHTDAVCCGDLQAFRQNGVNRFRCAGGLHELTIGQLGDSGQGVIDAIDDKFGPQILANFR